MKLQSLNLNALKRPIVLITVAVVVLLAALWWLLWMSPEGNKLTTVNSQVGTLNSQLTTLNQTLAQDKALTAKVQVYAGYLGMFAAAVPPLPEAPQLTSQLANLANATDVKLTTLSDDTSTPGLGTPLGEIPLSMNIQGSRQNCLAFLSGIYNSAMMPRLITISAFTPSPLVAPPGGVNVLQPSGATWTATISGIAYFDAEINPSATSSATTTSTTLG
jgi:Tfp pilus assembly protein PilO